MGLRGSRYYLRRVSRRKIRTEADREKVRRSVHDLHMQMVRDLRQSNFRNVSEVFAEFRRAKKISEKIARIQPGIIDPKIFGQFLESHFTNIFKEL